MPSNNQEPSISVDIQHEGQCYWLTIKAVGKVTFEDYDQLSARVDAALADEKDPRIRVMFDATAMTGWELRAAWEDFLLGFRYARFFEKVAIYGNKDWQEIAAEAGDWFIAGEMEFFDDYEEATSWLKV